MFRSLAAIARADACDRSSKSSLAERLEPVDIFPADMPPAPAAGEPLAVALDHVDRLLAEAGALLALVPAHPEDAPVTEIRQR